MTHDLRTGVSLYSFQEDYYVGRRDLEGCIAAAAELGAEGIETLAEQMMPGFPNLTDEFYQTFAGWMTTATGPSPNWPSTARPAGNSPRPPPSQRSYAAAWRPASTAWKWCSPCESAICPSRPAPPTPAPSPPPSRVVRTSRLYSAVKF